MKLEVGKKYVTRGGDVVEIVEYRSGRKYPFLCRQGNTYTQRGTLWFDRDSKLDLIREHEEPKMKPHVHAELIKAWADGVEVERLYFTDINEAWIKATLQDICEAPSHAKFRLKPQPKPDVVVTGDAYHSDGYTRFSTESDAHNLRLVFRDIDGVSTLVDAEVIKCT